MQRTSDVYKHLYHYTNWDGLNGILDSQSLWATNYRNLNDEKEIVLFLEERLPHHLKPHIKKIYSKRIFDEKNTATNFFDSGMPFDDVVLSDTKLVGECLFNTLGHEIYICSFSGESTNENINKHGLLSQWRAYGDDGGYCIVFDTKKLESLMNEEHKMFSYAYTSLADIIYSDDDEKFNEEYQGHLEEIAEFSKEIAFISGKNKIKPPAKAPFEAFISSITKYKHFGFKEENEVRLTGVFFAPELDKNRKLKTILNASHRPYIDMFKDLDTPLPIKEIIVGPHIEKSKRAEILKNKLGHTNIKISVSEIPYVGKRTNV